MLITYMYYKIMTMPLFSLFIYSVLTVIPSNTKIPRMSIVDREITLRLLTF